MKNNTKIWLIGIGIGVAVTGVTAYIFRKELGIAFGKVKSKFNRTLAEFAEAERQFWNGRTENDPSIMDRLREYWQKGTGTYWSDSRYRDEAWSAAFISYVMKKAGAGDDFKYSTSHSVYIRDTVKNRKENNPNPFKGYRPNEVKVAVGDLVCRPRQGGVTYDTTGSYISHCDVVTKIGSGKATMIGGNVSHTVKKTDVKLDSQGKVAESQYHVVIKNEKK